MKSRKIMLTIASISVLLNVGGCTVKQKKEKTTGLPKRTRTGDC